jgi:hypothetical protein
LFFKVDCAVDLERLASSLVGNLPHSKAPHLPQCYWGNDGWEVMYSLILIQHGRTDYPLEFPGFEEVRRWIPYVTM